MVAMKNAVKFSLILTTLMGLIFQWPLINQEPGIPQELGIVHGHELNWLVWLSAYVVSFVVVYVLQYQKPEPEQDHVEDSPSSISPAHLEALYKQAMIVERNAIKANTVFDQQLHYVHKLVEKTKNLEHGKDFDTTHASLVKELAVLEQHVQRLVLEMNKNVKLGEKLQQSVANIDPEIGVMD